jgi:hypothetical protein
VTARIAIYGATGVTGTMVSEALAGRAELVLLGRDRGKLDALAARVGAARVAHPDELRDAIAGARVVIGCAGPFAEVGEPVLAAAIAAGAHYLDIAGEQAFLLAMYERYESAARRAHVCAIPGMGFEVAPGDLAAACAAQALCGVDDGDEPLRDERAPELAADDPLDEVTVTYVLDGFAPTPCGARSMRAALAGPGYVWRNERWDVIAPAAERRRVNAGAELGGERDATSYPRGEVITVPRHVATARVQTFSSFERSGWLARATSILSPALPLISRVMPAGLAAAFAEPDAADPEARAAAAIAGRTRATFGVIAQARRRFEEKTVVVTGRDVHATTAAIVSWAALALAARDHGPCGVLAPAEVFTAQVGLEALALAARMRIATAET